MIGEAVAKAMSGREDAPDHILLVETEGRPWYLWPLKEGADVYPNQRLLGRGFVTLLRRVEVAATHDGPRAAAHTAHPK